MHLRDDTSLVTVGTRASMQSAHTPERVDKACMFSGTYFINKHSLFFSMILSQALVARSRAVSPCLLGME